MVANAYSKTTAKRSRWDKEEYIQEHHNTHRGNYDRAGESRWQPLRHSGITRRRNGDTRATDNMSAWGVNVCENHDDCLVVYTGKNCPICDLISDNDTTIADLKEELSDANAFIKEGETA